VGGFLIVLLLDGFILSLSSGISLYRLLVGSIILVLFLLQPGKSGDGYCMFWGVG